MITTTTALGVLHLLNDMPQSSMLPLPLHSPTNLKKKTARRRADEPRAGQQPASKEGCLQCRIRKKKCDERKPTCLGCERNVLLCRWRSAADTPCAERLKSGVQLDDTSFIQSVRAGSATPPGSSPPTGLLTSQGVKRCHSEATQIVRQPALAGQMLKDVKSSILYEHWVAETANALSTLRGHRNAFVTELPKLAFQYPNTVLPSLLALSGVHYCNKNSNKDMQQLTYAHLAQALQALKYGITKHVSGFENNALPLLVTTLILCFIETTRGDDKGNLQHHLRAARPLLLQVFSCKELRLDDSVLEFLKEYYAYIACITDLTADPETDSSDVNVPSGIEPLTSDRNSGMLFGCAYDLFRLIPDISKLAARVRKLCSHAPEPPEIFTFNEECRLLAESQAELHSRIISWQPPPNSDPDFVLCGKIYQQALLVYHNSAYHGSLGELSAPLFLHESLDAVTSLLNFLPLDAPGSATLIWPLAFLGTLAKEQYHRKVIFMRLEAIWKNMAAGNVRATMDFLSRVWADDGLATTHGIIALKDQMKRHGIHLSFV